MGSRVSLPDLKNLMDKRLTLSLNGKRQVTGVLRGYDAFMNVVLDDTTEDILAKHAGDSPAADLQNDGVLEHKPLGLIVLRGNSIETLECRERVS
jgi:small nuclear ribonucleoprotein G